jgi:flagellar hook-length control protein FliK
MTDGTVHVTVRAEQTTAARLLEQHLDDLGAALDAGGLEVGDVRVAPAADGWTTPARSPGERDLLDRPAQQRSRDHDDPDEDAAHRRSTGAEDHLPFDALL